MTLLPVQFISVLTICIYVSSFE